MLPTVVVSLIFDYKASMEEYDRRRCMHDELFCAFYFRSIRLMYVNLYTMWDATNRIVMSLE